MPAFVWLAHAVGFEENYGWHFTVVARATARGTSHGGSLHVGWFQEWFHSPYSGPTLYVRCVLSQAEKKTRPL